MKKKSTLVLALLVVKIFNAHSQDTWVQKADFGGTARLGAIGFNIGDKGYIGTGYDGTTLKKDIWEYTPATNVWTQKADCNGPAREYAVAFVINGFGYISTGIGDGGGGSNTLKDLWQYDPVGNTWTKRADLPGGARYTAVGFSIGNKGYIGTGYNNNNLRRDFWEYDPASDSWTQKNHFGGKAVLQAVGFSIGNRGYIGTGNANFNLTDRFWQYNPTNDSWTRKANYPGKGLLLATGFSIGSKGYIGLGADTDNVTTNEFWAYDTLTNSWGAITSFPGDPRREAVGFSINGKGYVGTGNIGVNYSNIPSKDFWEYTPGCSTPNGFTTTGTTNSSATLQWNAADGAIKYKLRYKVTGSNSWTTIYPTGTSKTITGLSAGTFYTGQVKSICSIMPLATSDWSVKLYFSTALRLGLNEATSGLHVYPNPFTSSTTLSFSLHENSYVTIQVLDLEGRKIKTLLNGYLAAGDHELQFNRAQITTGIYLLQLKANSQNSTIKIVVN